MPRVEEKDFAYVRWGIDDATHEVVGTRFNPDEVKAGSNTVLQLWLAQHLKPSIAFEFRRVAHPDGAVVLLEIPIANIAPVSFDDIAYVRIGSTTPKLTDYPERQQKLINNLRPYVWEKGIAKGFISADEVLKLLDYPAYFKLLDKNLPEQARK